jgi:Na+-translocating ferredoxin:NAD+ oxidoreductase RnfG subunit
MTRTPLRWMLPFGLAVPAFHAAYAAQYMTVEEAQQAAFAAATRFVPVALARADLDAALAAVPQSALAGWAPKLWQARSDERALGWLFVDQVIGKSEAITYALALDSSGKVIALDVLEYRETHGSEIRLPAWRRQFAGKDAHDPLRLDADIRNISGATLSCRHVTDGVRRLLALAARALPAGA